MNILFKKVILHNFLSFSHCELDLGNRDYCSVKGVNECTKDNALSNGSGKSSLWNSICWCLTGETIQGNATSVKNINIEEKSCYVTLYFEVDKNSFEVTRIREPKPDLKIIMNDQDISGKGVTGGNQVLKTYLPDLDKNLLSSVVFLGQGNPNTFTSHTPSGRKELLEKLSKSDYMIEDIKKRVQERKTEISSEMREIEDGILVKTTEINANKRLLEGLNRELEKYNTNIDYDSEIKQCEISINSFKEEIERMNVEKERLDAEITLARESINTLGNKQYEEKAREQEGFTKVDDALKEKEYAYTNDMRNISKTIDDYKNIKDVCPTCGQKIPGVIKKDTSELEKQLEDVRNKWNEVKEKRRNLLSDYTEALEEIKKDYENKTKDYYSKLATLKEELEKVEKVIRDDNSELIKYTSAVAGLKTARDGYLDNKKRTEDSIKDAEEKINQASNKLEEYNTRKSALDERLNIVTKISTLVSRDFRGYLLTDIIQFIEKKAKEYCVEVFGNDELRFYLDGNNIVISYCNKDYELLSGGEKQKVDIILQFALRDMMSVYLDFSCNVIILDEIFDFLDATGVNNVLNLVVNNLNDIESVFIISHHSDELSIPFDSEIVVRKNEEGISEVI